MHRGARHRIAPYQLVATINIDVVLVTVMRLAMLFGPARILVFLAVFGGSGLPFRRGLACFDLGIVVARVALARGRNDRRVNDLAGFWLSCTEALVTA